MKTTIEISDKLLKKAKSLAKARKTTLRKIIEESLQKAFGLKEEGQNFKLKDKSYGKQGLNPVFENYEWEKIRAEIYHSK